ncbi:uncharacterized protein LOC128547723 [Mercenaria mercenaria]|uniref:uncharacterized protein LOC128547723 n=1 Tax=Mercenaria mercenaria TaxID=6596 RepID=UPI00234F63DC|nr:uncharacterized protein LOC128547723 [Mercenaria mercenaria]
MQIFLDCANSLCVPLAQEKTEGPCEVIIFLGLEIDTVQMVVRIPQSKVEEVIKKIEDLIGEQKTTLREMQSLIGYLNFCCRAIAVGRPFCRRLINSICGLTMPHHHLRISKGVRLDLAMWLKFFKAFNGISVFHDRYWLSNVDMNLYTDSAGGPNLGFGIYFQGQWSYAPWPADWHSADITKDITALELFPILVSLHIWGSQFQNKKIKFNCDNMAVVHIINTMTSRSDNVMCILRLLTLACLDNNTLIRAQLVEGSKNLICDALSRLQLNRFRDLAPEAELEPCPFPTHLWNVFNPEQSNC